uniref:translation initiation factor IF-2-like n=1 Tax=Nyctereutes procyonoides TaxID=34880 RepID=UPI002443C69D|nr:translation initiation factor IF-2-like [Nyctereutes procyonoides]
MRRDLPPSQRDGGVERSPLACPHRPPSSICLGSKSVGSQASTGTHPGEQMLTGGNPDAGGRSRVPRRSLPRASSGPSAGATVAPPPRGQSGRKPRRGGAGGRVGGGPAPPRTAPHGPAPPRPAALSAEPVLPRFRLAEAAEARGGRRRHQARGPGRTAQALSQPRARARAEPEPQRPPPPFCPRIFAASTNHGKTEKAARMREPEAGLPTGPGRRRRPTVGVGSWTRAEPGPQHVRPRSAQETPSTWLRLCFRAQLMPQPLTAFGPGVQQGVQPLMSGERRTPGIKYDVPRARSPRGPEDEVPACGSSERRPGSVTDNTSQQQQQQQQPDPKPGELSWKTGR